MAGDFVEHMGIQISKANLIWIFDDREPDGGFWCGAMCISRDHAVATQQWLEYDRGIPCCIKDARGLPTPFDAVDGSA